MFRFRYIAFMDAKVLSEYQSSRGKVIIIENDKTRTREELSAFWKNKEINGHKVLDVESFALPIIRRGSPIGLLI